MIILVRSCSLFFDIIIDIIFPLLKSFLKLNNRLADKIVYRVNFSILNKLVYSIDFFRTLRRKLNILINRRLKIFYTCLRIKTSLLAEFVSF